MMICSDFDQMQLLLWNLWNGHEQKQATTNLVLSIQEGYTVNKHKQLFHYWIKFLYSIPIFKWKLLDLLKIEAQSLHGNYQPRVVALCCFGKSMDWWVFLCSVYSPELLQWRCFIIKTWHNYNNSSKHHQWGNLKSLFDNPPLSIIGLMH